MQSADLEAFLWRTAPRNNTHRVYAPSTPENAELKLAKLEAWKVYVGPFEMKIAEKRRTDDSLFPMCFSPSRKGSPPKGLGGADHSTFHTQMILHQNLEHFQSGQGLEKMAMGWGMRKPWGTCLDFGGESNLGTEIRLLRRPLNWLFNQLERVRFEKIPQEPRIQVFQLMVNFHMAVPYSSSLFFVKCSPQPTMPPKTSSHPHLRIRD